MPPLARSPTFLTRYIDGVVDVLEIDKPSETELGRVLRVRDVASYSDLDELLVSHVQALASKVERLMQHEKYHPEHDIGKWLVCKWKTVLT